MAEINLRVDLGLARGIEEVSYQREWVAVFLGQLV